MRIRIFLIVTSVLFFSHAYSQSKLRNRGSLIGSVGVAFLRYKDNVLTEPYPTLELRIGASVEKELGGRFLLQAIPRLGFKTKASSQYEFSPTSFDQEADYYKRVMDKTLSAHQHYFVELPITIHFKVGLCKFGTGLAGRYFFKNTASQKQTSPSTDFRPGVFDLGIPIMFSYKKSDSFTFGV